MFVRFEGGFFLCVLILRIVLVFFVFGFRWILFFWLLSKVYVLFLALWQSPLGMMCLISWGFLSKS